LLDGSLLDGSSEATEGSTTLRAKLEVLSKQLLEEREAAAAQSELWKRQLKTLRERARVESDRARQLEDMLHGKRASMESPDGRHAPSEGRQGTPATPHESPQADPPRRTAGGHVGKQRRPSSCEGITFGGSPSSRTSAGGGGIRLSLPNGTVGGRHQVEKLRKGVEKMLDNDGEELRKGVEKVGKAIGKHMDGLDTRVDRGLDRMEAIVGKLARTTGIAPLPLPSPNGQFAALPTSTPEARTPEVRNLMDE